MGIDGCEGGKEKIIENEKVRKMKYQGFRWIIYMDV